MSATTFIVGSRVEAWAGHRTGQFGTVARVHGRDWWIVRWDDDGEEERADMCFAHGDDWKKRPPTSVHQKTEAQLRASVNEFTQDDPPPYRAAT